MNKTAVHKLIMAALTARAALHMEAAKAAHAEATDEENKAEDKYDTRGLEASYLAAGQAKQMAELADAIQQFGTMSLRKFGPQDPIDIGALVVVETRAGQSAYFVGPGAGGTEVECGKETVMVITPQSPLGVQLAGRKQGDRLRMKIGGRQDDYLVASVS